MITLTVTSKDEVTLRKDVLAHLGVQPGDKFTVEKLPNGRLEVRAVRSAGRIFNVFGFLKKMGSPSLSIDDMNEIAAEGWAGTR
jgi:hypothetical protein